MGGACGTHMREERRIQGFGGETRGKRCGRRRDRQEDNIKIDLQDVGWERGLNL